MKQCPARDAECHSCKTKAHYSAQCFHSSVADVTIPAESDTTDYSSMVYLNTAGADQTTTWNCTVLLDGKEVTFKVDTGVENTRNLLGLPAFQALQVLAQVDHISTLTADSTLHLLLVLAHTYKGSSYNIKLW